MLLLMLPLSLNIKMSPRKSLAKEERIYQNKLFFKLIIKDKNKSTHYCTLLLIDVNGNPHHCILLVICYHEH